MKRITAFLLTLLICFCFCSCKKEESQTVVKNDWETIVNSNSIKIGVFESEYLKKDAQGNFVGINADIIMAICTDLGLSYELIEVNAENYFNDIDNNTVDCVWGVKYNNTIAEKYDCSIPYIVSDIVAVFPRSRSLDFTTKESLKNLKTIVAVNNTLAFASATDTGIICESANSQEDALLKVLSGSAQACIIDYAEALLYLNSTEYSALSVGATLNSYDNVIVYKKDSQSNVAIRSSLKKLIENGTLDTIAKSYGLNSQLPSNRTQAVS